MADIQHTHKFKTDVDSGLIRWPGAVLIGLGDQAADVFRISLTKESEPCADIENAVGYFVRPDGLTVPLEGAVDGNVISVTLSEECYEHAGVFKLTISASSTAGEEAVSASVIIIEGRVLITRTAANAGGGSIWNIDDLWAALNDKVSEPSSEGTSGQALLTDGNGNRYWGSAASSGATGSLIVDGITYSLRTGSSGAAGYITLVEEE